MRLANAVLVSAIMLATMGVSGAVPGEVSSVSTLLKSTSAALHAELLPKLHGWRATLSGISAGLSASGEMWVEPQSNASAQYIRLSTFSEDSGFDGHNPWSRDDKGVVWVEGSKIGRSLAVNEAFRDCYALWSSGVGGARVTAAGKRSEKGSTFDVLRVSVRGSTVPFDVWIDHATHLPVRYVESASGIMSTTTLARYRVVGGVLMPYSVRTVTNQGNETNFTAARIEANPPDLGERVRKPAATVHDYAIAGGTTTTIPFDLIDNHVYLNVMLNGRGPYRFVFDTGGRNIIDPAVLHELAATAKGSVQGSGVGAKTEEVQFGVVRSLRVGNADLRDQLFAVLPVRAGFAAGGSAPIDGLIGWEVLARFVTTFDYANRTITLGTAAPPSGETAIPFVFSGTQPEIACAIAGIPSRCTIDTGSRSSLDLMRPFLDTHPAVVPANVTALGMNGFGLGGGDIGRLGRLRSLEIAGFTLRDLIAGFSGATSGAFAQEGVAANIGGGVWKRFAVIFDYPHQTVTLKPNAAYASRDEYERAGLFAITRGGKLIVADVRPKTPAASAGLAKGDVITTLNGKSAARLSLGDLRAAFHEAAGTVIRLSVQRGSGAASKKVITLRDFV